MNNPLPIINKNKPEGFIYIHTVDNLDRELEGQVHIGIFNKGSNRMNNHCSAAGGRCPTFKIIKVVEVPNKYKFKYRRRLEQFNTLQTTLGNHHIFEAYCHDLYSKDRQRNPLNNYQTEWFLDPNNIYTSDKIMKDGKEAGFILKYIQTISNRDELDTFLQNNNIKKEKKSKPREKKINPLDKIPEEYRLLYLNNPPKFIRDMIFLSHYDLRTIQLELNEIYLNKYIQLVKYKTGDHEADITDYIKNIYSKIFNGLIEWPTGVGKSVAIIICIIWFYNFTILTKSPCKIIVMIPQNNIGDQMVEILSNLELLGIKLFKAHNGNFSKLKNIIKKYIEPCVILTTNCAMVTNETNNIKDIDRDFIIADECHHITSPAMFNYLINRNKKIYLMGFSATCKKNSEQKQKMDKLFRGKGIENGYISKCSIHKAVTEGWVNKPIYTFAVAKENWKLYLVKLIESKISERKEKNMWKCKKIIVWKSDTKTNCKDIIYMLDQQSEYKVYNGLIDTQITKFKDAKIRKNEIGILVACRKAREAFDGRGLEFGICY